MPYLGSTLFVATLVVFLLASLVGSVLLAGALLTGVTARAAEVTARNPFRSIALGLPVVVIGSLIAVAALQGGGAAKALGAGLAASMMGAMLCGLSAISLLVGTRLWVRSDEVQPYRRLLRGATVIVLASVLPLFGWFVVFPLAISAGVGGLLRGLVARRSPVAMHPPIPGQAYANR